MQQGHSKEAWFRRTLPLGFQMDGWIKPWNALRVLQHFKTRLIAKHHEKLMSLTLSTEIAKIPPAGAMYYPGTLKSLPWSLPHRGQRLC